MGKRLEPTLRETLADNLNRLISQSTDLTTTKKVAKKSGLGNGTIGRLRNAQTGLTLDKLEKLARAFEVEPWQLLAPGFEPENPYVLPTSPAQKAAWRQIEAAFKAVREEDKR